MAGGKKVFGLFGFQAEAPAQQNKKGLRPVFTAAAGLLTVAIIYFSGSP
jgi:hypothetical protein